MHIKTPKLTKDITIIVNIILNSMLAPIIVTQTNDEIIQIMLPPKYVRLL